MPPALRRSTSHVQVTAAELTYNGQGLDAFVPERTAAYISQLDDHFGELTVRETLEFAARVQGGKKGAGSMPALLVRACQAGGAPRAVGWLGRREPGTGALRCTPCISCMPRRPRSSACAAPLCTQ